MEQSSEIFLKTNELTPFPSSKTPRCVTPDSTPSQKIGILKPPPCRSAVPCSDFPPLVESGAEVVKAVANPASTVGCVPVGRNTGNTDLHG